MGGSLDDLIVFLLDEIALGGEAGARVSDVLLYIDRFYAEQHHEQSPDAEDDDKFFHVEEKQTIDRLFQEQVWRWLTAHPEIWVGRDGLGNGMSLKEVEDYNEKLRVAELSGATCGENADTVASDSAQGRIRGAGLPQAQSQTQTSVPQLPRSNFNTKSSGKSPLRIFTSRERMWLAAAGHGPDLEKIADMEFTCLSIIAAHREQGIMQPDLVRISGQDKRSVPGRTQSLHDKGYIEKRPIRLGLLKTSLLILKRFAGITENQRRKLQQEMVGTGTSVENGDSLQPSQNQCRLLEVEPKTREMFGILRDMKIMTWDDLKRKLGVWRQARPSHNLAKAVRRWEFLGFVQRVRVAGSIPRLSGKPYRCVKLVREPKEKDWATFFALTRDYMQQNTPVGQDEDFDNDAEGDADEDYQPDDSLKVLVADDENVEDLDVTQIDVPQWSSDRPLVNMLYDIIHASGTNGISIQGIKDQLVGNFFNRPLEHQLTRLVDLWQISQPLHLRHYAIIRDTTLTGKIAHYVHYSYQNFKTKVASGEASWEAVETMKHDNNAKEVSKLAAEAVPDLDEYGFPKLDQSLFQGRDNDATLAECVQAARFEPFRLTLHDPIPIKLRDGTYDIRLGQPTHRFSERPASGRPRQKTTGKPSSKPEKSSENLEENDAQTSRLVPEKQRIRKEPRGRPRKYPKEGLPKDADELTPEQLVSIKKSQMRAKEYETKKIEQETARRAATGQDVDEARRDVLAAAAAQKKLEADVVALKVPRKRTGRRALKDVSVSPIRVFFNETQRSRYLPSVAAHTFAVYPAPGSRQAGRPRQKNVAADTSSFVTTRATPKRAPRNTQPDSKVRAGRKARLVTPQSALGYFPSIAAHTIACSQLAEKIPLRINDKPKTSSGRTIRKTAKAREQLSSPTLPLNSASLISPEPARELVAGGATLDAFGTVVEQTQFLLQLAGGHRKPRKRNADVEALLATEPLSKRQRKNGSNPPYFPSVAAHSRSYLKQDYPSSAAARSITLGPEITEGVESSLSAEIGSVKPYSSYSAQAAAIRRPSNGVFIGELGHYKIPHARGRPRRSRIAIFKLPGLHQLDWFKVELDAVSLAGAFSSDRVTAVSATRTTPRNVQTSRTISETASKLKAQDTEQAAQVTHAKSVLPQGQPLIDTTPTPAYRARSDLSLSSGVPYVPYTSAAGKELKRKRPLSSDVINMGPRRPSLSETEEDSRRTRGIREIRLPPASRPQNQQVSKKPDSSGPNQHSLTELDALSTVALAVDDRMDISVDGNATFLAMGNASRDIPPYAAMGRPRKKPRVAKSVLEEINRPVSEASGGRSPRNSTPAHPHNSSSSPVASTAKPSSDGPDVTDTVMEFVDGEAVAIDRGKSSEETNGPPANGNKTVLPRLDEDVTPSYETELNGLPATQTDLRLESRKDRSDGIVQETMIAPTEPGIQVTSMNISNNSSALVNDHAASEANGLETSNITSKRTKAPKVNKITPTGGSIALLRRTIILEIVEKCDGVFPGDKELWYPFTTIWQRRTGAGKPDQRTIRAAQKYLVDIGKLRLLKFTFKTKIGVPHIGTIITLPDVDGNDPRVRECQRRMIECDPRSYIPEKAEVSPELSWNYKSATDKQYVNRLQVEEGTVDLHYVHENAMRAHRARLSNEDRSHADPYRSRRQVIEPEIIPGVQTMKRLRRLHEAEEELGEPDFEIAGYKHNAIILPSERAGKVEFLLPGGTKPEDTIHRPRVQRLARLGGPLSRLPGLTGTTTRTGHVPGHLMKLNTQATGPQIPSSARIPLRKVPIIRRSTLRTKPRVDYAAIHRGHEPASLTERMKQLSRELAGSGTSSATRPRLQFMETLGLHSNFDRTPSTSPEPEEIVGQGSWLDPTLDRLIDPGNGDRMDRDPGSGQPFTRRPRTQAGVERRRQQISSFVEPEQIFHDHTGTFSTEFWGFGPTASPALVLKKPEKKFVMPQNLDDIMSVPVRGKPSQWFEIPGHEIGREIQNVLSWELENMPPEVGGKQELRFVNHNFPGEHEVAEDAVRTIDLEKDLRTYEEDEVVLRVSKSSGTQETQRALPPPKIIPTKPKAPILKTRRLTSLLEKPSSTPASIVEEIDVERVKRPKFRGPQLSKEIGPDGDRQILVAVIIVRTLTGGVEQNIDWVLLARIFEPRWSERLIHRRWAWILQKYRLIIDKMQADFQEMFAQAYEDGSVPPLDYDHLEDYDWKWLMEWTFKNIDAPKSSIPDLPATRDKLDDLFELRPTNDRDMQDFFELNGITTIPKRHSILHRDPYVIPVPHRSQPPPTTKLDVAKSWVRSNVITPESTYSPTFARAKLSVFDDSTIETAVRDLLQAKVLMQENKGRLLPGRNYDISEHFLSRLRKNLGVSQYQRAAAYKSELDAAFREQGKALFSYHAVDGDVLAVMNLSATGRIKLKGVDIPNNPFGLMESGYKTRFMDKSRLRFAVEVFPTDTYVEGNPLLPLPAPPSMLPTTLPVPDRTRASSASGSDMDVDVDARGMLDRYPAWIDINGDLLPLLWNMALAAVLTVVMLRPGVSALEVEKCVAPSLEVWEVQEIMGWIVKAGVGKWTVVNVENEDGWRGKRRGLMVGEWWWLCVGEEKGKGRG